MDELDELSELNRANHAKLDQLTVEFNRHCDQLEVIATHFNEIFPNNDIQ